MVRKCNFETKQIFIITTRFDTEIFSEQRLNIIILQPRMYQFNPITDKFTILLDRTTEGLFVITHPDLLISGTVVAGSFFCERKTILQEMIRCKETELAKHALIGTILHEIFQQVICGDKIYGTLLYMLCFSRPWCQISLIWVH